VLASPYAPGSELDHLIAEFAGSKHGAVHVRSRTATREWQGRRIHLKTSEANLAAEAKALQVGSQISNASWVSAVKLVHFDAERNVLVTEHVTGTSLFNVLWNETSFFRSFERSQIRTTELAVATTAWIVEYHRLTSVAGSQQQCRDRLRRSFEAKIDAIVETFPEALDRHVASIRSRFTTALSVPNWNALPIAQIHADYHPANMIRSVQGQIVVLDFADSRLGFALEDITRFWTSIWEISECGQRRHRTLVPLLGMLLDAAGLDRSITSSDPFLALRMWNAVTKINQAVAMRQHASWSTRRIVGRLLKAHQRWLFECCES
jgi:aminoglycoside phosphotransferase (APT) family kinase protein